MLHSCIMELEFELKPDRLSGLIHHATLFFTLQGSQRGFAEEMMPELGLEGSHWEEERHSCQNST